MAAMGRPQIHVRFRRSGGFAGISLTAAADADSLGEEHAAQLQSLLRSPEVPQEPDHAAPGSGGADRFQYQLDLDDGQHRRSFAWSEAQVPEEMRPLVDYLTQLARPG
jgi:hypothetical protein